MGGRKKLDPAKTREAIFEAALAQFALKGFEGASIADVAEAAGVQKSLVQYHFGTKAELWSATIGDRAKSMFAVLERAVKGEIPPRNLIAARFEFFRKNPQIVRIFSWFSLTDFPLPKPIQERREAMRSVTGGQSGVRLDLLLGLCALDGWLQNRKVYAAILGDDLLDPVIEERLLKTVMKTMERIDCEERFARELRDFLARVEASE